MSYRTHLLQIITWVTALLLAVAVLRQVPGVPLSHLLARPSGLQWCLWVLINVLTISILVVRWQVLIRPIGVATGFVPLLLVRQASQLISFITPGPQFGGEPLQVYWLWKNYRLPGHTALLAVGLDRFYELWVNFAVLLFMVLVLLATSTIDTQSWLLIASFLTVLVVLLSLMGRFLLLHPHRISAGLQRLANRWQQHAVLRKLDTQWNRVSFDLLALTSHKRSVLLLALLWSLLGWFGMFVELWLLLTIFVPQANLTDLLVIFVAIRVALLLPLPGGIGSLEAALLWACQGLGLPVTAALGLIVLTRLRDAGVMTGGLLALRYLNARPSS